MHGKIPRLLTVMLITSTLCGCSSTSLSGSWRNPDYQQTIRKVYLVGVSRQATQRRIFEDEFAGELEKYGIQAMASYRELDDAEGAGQEQIMAKARSGNANALLITRILGRHTEEVVRPGRIYGYPYEPWGYPPRPYYYRYRDYYDRRFDMLYEPATIASYRVLTLESNLYDAASGELIWSAQLETVVGDRIEAMIRDFIEVVIQDLIRQGLI